MHRTLFLRTLLLISLSFFLLPWDAASGQAYPTRPIRFVVGGSVGAGWDLAARLLAEKMREDLGQSVVIENKVGSEGVLSATLVAQSAPDGYTLLPAVSSQMTMNPVLIDKLSYDPVHGFEPISLIGLYPPVLVVSSTLPVNSVKDLIAYAKANPGRLNYGSGTNSFFFATELFKQKTGIDVLHIPYKGNSQTVTALLAGDVQMAIVDVTPALAHIRSGKLKALAVTTSRRLSLLPDVPTLAEAADIPGFEVVLWIALFAPAGTPKDIVERLNLSVVRSLETPDLRERLLTAGIIPVSSTPQALAERMRRDIGVISEMAKAGRLKVN